MGVTQNFDAGTSLPAGWNGTGSDWSISGSAHGLTPTSSPYMLFYDRPSNGTNTFTYGTADGNGGDATVACSINQASASGYGVQGVTARGTAATLTVASTSFYAAWVNYDTGQVGISLWVNGTETVLAHVTPGLGVESGWLAFAFTLSGSSLTLRVQALSSGHYLRANGIWGSGSANCLSLTDSTLSGSSYWGVFASGASEFYAGFDDWSLDTSSGPSGSMAAAEGRDSASISGTAARNASMAVAEARDILAASGWCVVATAAVAERHDTASIVGASLGAILTTLEGADSPSLSGVFAAPAAMAATEGRDGPTMFAATRAAAMSASERGDTASIGGRFAAVATLSRTEGRDALSCSASVLNNPRLAAVEGRDSASVAGSFAAPARLSARERGDSASISGTGLVTVALAAVESRDRGAILAVAQAPPPFFKVKEAGDVARILGGSPTLRYNVYANGGLGDPIDYGVPIGTTGGTTFVTARLQPGTWKFGVRAANGWGEESNIDVAVTVVIDAYGRDASNIPAPPIALSATPTGGGRVRVEWGYPATARAQAPTGFHVYQGIGRVDYGSPVATISAPWTGSLARYSAPISGLADRTEYTFGVRAFNASGEETNTRTASAVARATGPNAVRSLSIEAVS